MSHPTEFLLPGSSCTGIFNRKKIPVPLAFFWRGGSRKAKRLARPAKCVVRHLINAQVHIQYCVAFRHLKRSWILHSRFSTVKCGGGNEKARCGNCPDGGWAKPVWLLCWQGQGQSSASSGHQRLVTRKTGQGCFGAYGRKCPTPRFDTMRIVGEDRCELSKGCLRP
jgi:hypothetical protein